MIRLEIYGATGLTHGLSHPVTDTVTACTTHRTVYCMRAHPQAFQHPAIPACHADPDRAHLHILGHQAGAPPPLHCPDTVHPQRRPVMHLRKLIQSAWPLATMATRRGRLLFDYSGAQSHGKTPTASRQGLHPTHGMLRPHSHVLGGCKHLRMTIAPRGFQIRQPDMADL